MSETDSVSEASFVDRPIERAAQDRFGRGPFAGAVASAISSWKGKESLTIALSAPWGAGKSSAKNLIVESLRATGRAAPHIVEFNPWKWPTAAEAAKAFFREISIALRRVDKTLSGEERAKRWDRYGELLTLTSELADGVVDTFPTLMIVAAFFGFGSATLVDRHPILALVGIVIGTGLATVGTVLKLSASAARKVAQWTRAVVVNAPLEELKNELKIDLSALSTSLLVIIDDVDRLNKEETSQLVQHIKANADFPNVIYLVLYQRDIVEGHLKTEHVSGRDYLEKIVDLQLDLPAVARSQLDKMLFEGLDKILSSIAGAVEFDQTRWGNVYLGGLQVFFQTPRNIKRFLTTLALHAELFKGAAAFEVNQIDLIAIEALRVFEPELYRAISSNEEILLKSGEDRDERKSSIQKLVELVSEDKRSQIQELLQEMFPRIAWAFGGAHYGDDWNEEWSNSLRICSSRYFQHYFRLSVPEGEISQSAFLELIGAAADRASFVSVFRRLEASGFLDSALPRLDSYKQKIPIDHAASLVPALFDVGDMLGDDQGFSVGPYTRIVRTALWYVRQEPSAPRRGEIILDAMNVSDGLAVPARLISGDQERRNRKNEDLLFADKEFEEAKSLWIKKFDAAINSDAFRVLAMPRITPMLYCWREWAGEDVVRNWSLGFVQSAEGAKAFLTAITSRVIRQSLGDKTGTTRLVANLRVVEDLCAVSELERSANSLDESTLSESEAKALRAFRRALKRRAEGKSDDGFMTDDDDE